MTCKALKEQSSMYAGIGRRMSSFLFGAGAPQGAALVGTISKQIIAAIILR